MINKVAGVTNQRKNEMELNYRQEYIELENISVTSTDLFDKFHLVEECHFHSALEPSLNLESET